MQAVELTAPMREFLIWVGRAPRTYAEAMEAWGSHCPRYTVWEDAVAAGLVCIDNSGSMDRACVTLTVLGRGLLRRERTAPMTLEEPSLR